MEYSSQKFWIIYSHMSFWNTNSRIFYVEYVGEYLCAFFCTMSVQYFPAGLDWSAWVQDRSRKDENKKLEGMLLNKRDEGDFAKWQCVWSSYHCFVDS